MVTRLEIEDLGLNVVAYRSEERSRTTIMRLELWNYFLVVLGVGVGGVRGRGAGGVLGRDGAPSECGRSPGRYEGDWGDE